jgi:hypothetical protein
VLVEEVEVPEAVNVAERGDVADGMALVGISQAGEDMPGRGDGEENRNPEIGLSCRQRRHCPLTAEAE